MNQAHKDLGHKGVQSTWEKIRTIIGLTFELMCTIIVHCAIRAKSGVLTKSKFL